MNSTPRGGIDWGAIRDKVPPSAHPLVALLEEAEARDRESPEAEIRAALEEKLASLQRRFTELTQGETP